MTKKTERLPIWESSSRPLYPKCVWVKGAGYRNFIIDYNIQKRRTSYGNNSSRSVQSDRALTERRDDHRMELIGSSDSHSQLSTVRNCRKNSKLNSVEVKSNFETIKRQLYKRFPRQKTDDPCDASVENVSASATASTSTIKCQTRDAEHLDISRNQLTERVLQWLDLAGRNTIIRPETELNKSHHPTRRICTTESIMMKKNTPSSANGQQSMLKRTESLHHLSLTFGNKDEQSIPATLRFGEFLPSSCRSTKTSMASGRLNSKTMSRPPSAAVALSSPPPTPPLNDGDIKEVVGAAATTTVEDEEKKQLLDNNNQYRILEKSSCNTQLMAKRQLHIFMPNLPKKHKIPTATPNEDGTMAVMAECDSSFLSTILSNNSQFSS